MGVNAPTCWLHFGSAARVFIPQNDNTRACYKKFKDAVPSSVLTRPRAWRDSGFGILVVTHSTAIVEALFHPVFRRVVKNPKAKSHGTGKHPLRCVGETENHAFPFDGGNTQTNLEIDKVLRPSARAVIAC